MLMARLSAIILKCMTDFANAELNTTLHGNTAPRRLPQFSLAALLLGMLLIAMFLGAIRWLGSIWIIPTCLATLCGANVMLAVYRKSNCRALNLEHWPIAAWLALATIATGFTVHGCLEYNKIAGTDKTAGHIIQISAATLAGPMVGPVANPGAGEYPQARKWTGILFVVLLLATSPFLLVRRVVSIPIAVICWLAFLGATILWFFGAMISLGVCLS